MYDFFSRSLRFFFETGYNVQTEGLENILTDTEGGIIVSNHDTPRDDWIYKKDSKGEPILHKYSVDQLLIGAYLNRNQRFHAIVSKNYYKNPIRKPILNLLQQIPATKNGLVEKSKEYIDKNEYVLIFPEGSSGQKSKVNPEEKLKIYSGLGRLVFGLDNPKIFPTYIQMNGKKDSPWPKFESVEVIFGEPFHYIQEFEKFPIDEKGNMNFCKISRDIMEEKVYSLEKL